MFPAVSVFKDFIFKFILEGARERAPAHVHELGEGQRVRGRGRILAGSTPGQEPDAGLDFMTPRS